MNLKAPVLSTERKELSIIESFPRTEDCSLPSSKDPQLGKLGRETPQVLNRQKGPDAAVIEYYLEVRGSGMGRREL